MAKRRTKDQKRRASERRVELRSLLPQAEVRSVTSESMVAQATPVVVNQTASNELAAVLAKAGKPRDEKLDDTASMQRLFGFDSRFLYQDLTKTIITSLVILVLLVVFSRLSF